MTTHLEIAALGPLRIKLDGAPADDLTSSKAEALLVYLACRGTPQPREAVAELLWPERTREQTLTNLRVTLSRLRRVAAPYLLATRQTVSIDPESDYRLDVAELEAGIAAHADPEHRPAHENADRLAQTLALYRGEFLEGFSLPDSPGFDEWVLMERERLHLLVTDALQELAARYLELEDYPAGIEQARRLVALDPLREAGYRLLMRALTGNGQRNAALRQYEICEQLLADELGVEPAPATRSLYEQFRTDPPSSRPHPPRATVSMPPSPYRGLNAFGEADADAFFGREAFTERLVQAVPRHPVTAVVGPSGSGKSSVVFAGLLPHLRRAADGGWVIAAFRPGSRPFYRLAMALVDLLEPDAPEVTRVIEARRLADAMAAGHLTLCDVTHRLLLRRQSGARLLLVVDQFEELYALCPDDERRRQFLDLLLAAIDPARPAARDDDDGCRLVLTLRADFLEQALTYRPIADVLQDAILILGPMTRVELHRAVEKPAAQAGVTFEAGLVERILEETGTEPGRLPLLQFALTSLWEHQEAGVLTHAAYEAIGGVSEALTRHAEGVYAALDEAEHQVARRVLLQLVRPGAGTDDTRRVATRAELGDRAWTVVRRLADARLVVTNRAADGDETVEVVHEALIHDWDRLRGWLDEDRAFRLWQERLRASLQQWEASDRDPRALLRGIALNEAERWSTERDDDLTAVERSFVTASLEARDRRQEAAAARREREAALVRRSRNRLRAFVAVLIVATLIALGLMAFALRQNDRAQAAADRSQRLAQAAGAQVALRDHDADLALALALAANRGADPPARARLVLTEAAYAPGTIRRFTGHAGAVRGVALLPAGDRALSASDDDTLRLWSLDSGETLRRFEGHTDDVLDVTVHPNGDRALSASADGTLILWNLETGDVRRRLTGHDAPVRTVAVGPDGETALSGADDGRLVLWNLADGTVRRRLAGHTNAVVSAAIADDGRTALSSSGDHTVILWDLTTGTARHRLVGHTDWVTDAAFTPDGRHALSASEDTSMLLWDLESGEIVRRFPYDTAGLLSAAVSPDGRTALATSLDSTIVLWDVATGRKQTQLLGHTGRIFDVAFTPDGRQALSAGEDGDLRLWRLHNGAEERRLHYEAGASSVALSDDGEMAATGLANGEISVWDVTTGAELQRLTGHTDRVFGGVHFLPDDETLLSASGEIFDVSHDNTLRIWDLATGAERHRLAGHASNVWDLAVDSAGRFALSASRDGTARLWNLDTQEEIRRYETELILNSVAFTPDDRTALIGTGRELPGGDEAADFSIRLWDVATGKEQGRLPGHAGSVMDVEVAPDGRQALSAGLDGLVLLWDLETGEVRRRLTGNSAGAFSVAFGPDGRTAVSGGFDRTLILWDLTTGAMLRRYEGHEDVITNVAFALDGRFVISAGGRDRTVRVWRVDPTQEALTAWIEENRYVPELTCEQRLRYGVRPLCEEIEP